MVTKLRTNPASTLLLFAALFLFLWLRSAIENARLRKALRETSEERTKFLTDIAHEFQTPICILRGNIAILAKTGRATLPTRSERINALYVANTTLDRLSRLVTNLLDVAKLNFSKNWRSEMVDVRALAEEAREDCAVLAEDKNIVISLTGDAVCIAGDKDKLKEVLLNLLSNALKHTPDNGSISILVRAREQEAEVVVADTGPGIASENLSQIFERFYRIEDGSHHAGTGLGLPICRQIIEAHSGTIVAESEPGNGSRFIIHLPLSPLPRRSSVIINEC